MKHAMKKRRTTRRRKNRSLRATTQPTLRFSPTAWAKLLFLRDYGETEVGGFGITAADDLLYVEDVALVGQVCSWAQVAFDDAAVADYFDRQVDRGLRPEQFGRLWAHTHPGDCPLPSQTDEATFERVFGQCDWAVMFILARDGHSYARLRFNVGPGGDLEIPVEVDYSRAFGSCDLVSWEEEYLLNVCPEDWLAVTAANSVFESKPTSRLDDVKQQHWRAAECEPDVDQPLFPGDET